jgi:hypothetical protein
MSTRISILILLTAISVSASPAVAAEPPSWSTPARINSTNLTSVSCPSTSFCVAVDWYGNYLTYNGSSWSAPASVGNEDYLTSVSCASASFCAAVDLSGHSLTYNGSSWSTPTLLDTLGEDQYMYSVSCASSLFCVAVDTLGNAMTYNGISWGAPVHIDSRWLTAVSCPSVSFCMAADVGGRVLTYNGSSWSAPASSNAASFSALSCASESFCIVLSQSAITEETQAFTYNGSSWSTPVSIDGPGEGVPALSCSSASFCVAMDDNGYAMTYNGDSWNSPTRVKDTGYGVHSASCSSSAFCVVVDGGGYEVTYSGSSVGLPPAPPLNLGLPVNTSPPAISGIPAIGQTLSCSSGAWAGDAPQSYAYSWTSAGTYVTGASLQSTYVVRPGDAGYGLACHVTATNVAGSASAASAEVHIPAPPQPIADQSVRQVVFVHGIRASCAKAGAGDYKALYDSLGQWNMDVYTFCYDHDEAFGGSSPEPTPTRCFSAKTSRGDARLTDTATAARERDVGHKIGPLYVSQNQGLASESNDGNSALAYDAAKLDDCLAWIVNYDILQYGHPLPIAVIGNSMGGAITRGWLQLAKSRHSTALNAVTTVFFLEGATEGSWIAKLGRGAGSGLSGAVGGGPSGWVADQVGGYALGQLGNVDFRRAGIQDLAPRSVWYNSIANSGPPPHLHYFALSVDTYLHFKEQTFLWQVEVGSSDVIGDGVMQMGSGSYSALPDWGGSRFLPFGESSDEHQYEINLNYDELLNLGGLPPAYITNPYSSPYNHFNFGTYMGKPNGGGLQVQSCSLGQLPTPIPSEITKDLVFTSVACGTSTSLTFNAQTATAMSTTSRPRGRQVAPRMAYTAVTASRRPSGTVGYGQPVIFRDASVRASMTLYTAKGPLLGSLTLEIAHRGAFVMTLPAKSIRHRTIILNTTVLATPLQSNTSATTPVGLKGTLRPAGHSAHLTIVIKRQRLRTVLITATANPRTARTASNHAIALFAHNDLDGLARMLAQPGTDPGIIARDLASQKVHIGSIKPRGNGHAISLADGNPGWLRPVTATFSAHPPLHVNLVLEQENGAWRLVGTTT